MNPYKLAVQEISKEKNISEKEILKKLPWLKKMTEADG